jgi:type VI secretion system protein ImpK
MAKEPAEPDPDKTVSDPRVAFDPDATVSRPVVAPEPGGAAPEAALVPGKAAPEPDPDATMQRPVLREPVSAPDAEATVRQPLPDLDPEATVRRPMADLARGSAPAGPDADATLTLPISALKEGEAPIEVPAPGRRRNPFAPKQSRIPVQANLAALGGLNPLIAAANPILGGIPHIRQSLRDPGADQLLQTLRRQIGQFEASADDAGISAESVAVANFALCALIDEAAAATPWGGHWLKAGLLQSLHGEELGGEKFFMLLAKMAENPAANRDLLEFFHVCLALGYEGRYRQIEDGKRQLDEVRAKIYEIVRRQRPPVNRVLSESWRAASVASRPAERGAPVFWAIAGAAAVILVGLQLAGKPEQAGVSTPPAQEPAQVKAPAPGGPPPPAPSAPAPTPPPAPSAVATAAPPPPAVTAPPTAGTPSAPSAPAAPAPVTAPVTATSVPTLADLARKLDPEIKRGLIAITDDPAGKRIEIRSDEMFASGGTLVAPRLRPILLRIAEALESVPGTITVTGHTDGVPINTPRFPSNVELSVARAQSAVQLMARKLSDPRRVKADGRGSAEPIAPNDTEANRAKNRRIVIALDART